MRTRDKELQSKAKTLDDVKKKKNKMILKCEQLDVEISECRQTINANEQRVSEFELTYICRLLASTTRETASMDR